MSRLGIEPGHPRLETSTLEKNHSNSLCSSVYFDPLQFFFLLEVEVLTRTGFSSVEKAMCFSILIAQDI